MFIVLLHYIGLFLYEILNTRKRLKLQKATSTTCIAAVGNHNTTNPHDDDDDDGHDSSEYTKDTLDNPMYIQRYLTVSNVLLDLKWRKYLKKLVDIGCAESNLLHYLKSFSLERILLVDVDESLLQKSKNLICPLLGGMDPVRFSPLEVSMYAGSVSYPDPVLQNTDVITAIELIEHLYPDTLDALPYNIFSYVRPKLAIFTTPNVEFNVVFGKVHRFRHADHKFEWTRSQFEAWAANVVHRFPDYIVEFSGIGQLQHTFKNIGLCSQMAVFIRKDVLYANYEHLYSSVECTCETTAPCRDQGLKLSCNCVCANCQPDFSLGVCTYMSCSLREYPESVYRHVATVSYPFLASTLDDTERILSRMEYRIRSNAKTYMFYYVEQRKRCEIPVSAVTSSNEDPITVEEAIQILRDAGYRVEKCFIGECTRADECIIIEPLPNDMDDVTQNSDASDGYSSKSSDCNEPPTESDNNVEPLSDWSEFVTADSNWSNWNELPETTERAASLQDVNSSRAPAKEVNSGPLFDSGYVKSPSPLEACAKLPPNGAEAYETDQFDDLVTTSSLKSDDNKLHLKKTVTKEKFSASLALMHERVAVDPNKINELDRFYNMSSARTFMNNYLRPQPECKWGPVRNPIPMPGTSSSWKRSRKSKDRDKKTVNLKKEPTPLDDAKSLTNCIVQNSLNIVDGDDLEPSPDIIQDLSPLQDADNINPVEANAENRDEVVVEDPPEIVPVNDAPAHVAVENGDLANNNRDDEGNNLLIGQEEDLDLDEGIDILNDNMEDIVVPMLEDNAIENNNDDRADAAVLERPVEAEEPPAQAVHRLEEEIRNSIENASREALFDERSEQDLLEEYDLPAITDRGPFDMLDVAGVVLVGIQAVDSRERQSDAASTNSFPNWLLEILGQDDDDDAAGIAGGRDDPHFYCQGDGLGVHPSVMAVEIDEAEDADNDTATTEESSSNNTVDYAEVDPGQSDTNDMSSLPEESLQVDDNMFRNDGTFFVNEIVEMAEDVVVRRALDDAIEPKTLEEQAEAAASSEDTGSIKHQMPHCSKIAQGNGNGLIYTEPVAGGSNEPQEPERLTALSIVESDCISDIESVHILEKSTYFDT